MFTRMFSDKRAKTVKQIIFIKKRQKIKTQQSLQLKRHKFTIIASNLFESNHKAWIPTKVYCLQDILIVCLQINLLNISGRQFKYVQNLKAQANIWDMNITVFEILPSIKNLYFSESFTVGHNIIWSIPC